MLVIKQQWYERHCQDLFMTSDDPAPTLLFDLDSLETAVSEVSFCCQAKVALIDVL